MENLHGLHSLMSAGATLAALQGPRVALILFLGAALAAILVLKRLQSHLQCERAARARAEREAALANSLQDLTAALSRARTPTEVVDHALPDLLHLAGADRGALILIAQSGQKAEVVKAIGCGDEGSPAPFTLADYPALAHSASRQEIASFEAAPAGSVPRVSALHAVRALDSAVVVPLVAGRRTSGLLVLGFAEGRTLRADDHEFFLAAGRRTAEAFARAGAYETVQRARADAETLKARADQELRERQKAEAALRESETKYRALAARTSRLYALSAALSQSITVEAVGAAVVRHGKVVAGASAGSVALLDRDRKMFELLDAGDQTGQLPESLRRFPAERGYCATAAVDTRQPVFVRSFVDSQMFWRSASVAADGGFSSAAVLPLIVKDAAIGVLTFHYTAPVHFDDEYTALLVSVTQHCAQAIDRARLYEAAERERAAAELANRSKDEFLSTVSHELRTPLTAVLGWAAMLRNGQIEPTRLTRAVDAIYSNATRQVQLIDELLDISRIVAGRAVLDLQELDLRDSIRGAVEAIMPSAAAKELELEVGACPSAHVTADPRRLGQIFLNLLANAVKFTPRGGRVAVDVQMRDRSAEVRIADTGSGIEPGFLPHVFERFRQSEQSTARTTGGLGLGLFIARQLTEAQGGTIRAHSDGPGTGAEFTVSFPLADPEPARRAAWTDGDPKPVPAPPDHLRPSLKGVRVLIVDDEPDIRELMLAALEGSGATVTAVGSAAAALEALAEREVDVLLADIAMPGQDGYDLIRAVRSLPSPRSGVPAAAVTACAREDERQRALAAGFQLHVPKPVQPAALVRVVAGLVVGAPS